MNQIIVTTTDIYDKKYEILEIVFAWDSLDISFKQLNPMETSSKVKDQLSEAGEKIGADAIIGTHFDYREGKEKGFPSVEVFAYGTAVKFV